MDPRLSKDGGARGASVALTQFSCGISLFTGQSPEWVAWVENFVCVRRGSLCPSPEGVSASTHRSQELISSHKAAKNTEKAVKVESSLSRLQRPLGGPFWADESSGTSHDLGTFPDIVIVICRMSAVFDFPFWPCWEQRSLSEWLVCSLAPAERHASVPMVRRPINVDSKASYTLLPSS